MKGTTRMWVIVLAMTTILATVATGAAVAERGGRGKGDSISLVMLSAPIAGATESWPHFGDQVTFSISTTATDQPYVNVNCYQNGAWVEGDWQAFFNDPNGYTWSQIFNLGPTMLWPSGPADCMARLVTFTSNWRDKTLATTSFHVDA